jgi:DNA polymerase
MAWDDRRRALLAELGVRLWEASSPDVDSSDTVVADPVRPGGEAGPGEAHAPVVRAVPVSACVADTGPSAAEAALAGESRDAIGRMDWPELRRAVAGCTACGLCAGRTNTVFGAGHPDAHWMIVGEAPGEQEDRQGEPFVGRAGKLLDNMLRALGLGRGGEAGGLPSPEDPARQVFIANVLKCRPPMNRNPRPDEVAQCEPFLRRQVALVRPRVILAMGRFAVQSLLKTDLPIGKLRGRMHAYEGVPLVVTYHPAYLLRQPADKARAWEDLCLARAALGPAGRAAPPPLSGP